MPLSLLHLHHNKNKQMKIYTVIPYYSDCEGMEVFLNDVKSFTTFEKAEEYAYTFSNNEYDIVESELD